VRCSLSRFLGLRCDTVRDVKQDCMQDESDQDIQGMVDQIAVAMLSQTSSPTLRRASVDLVHLLCQRCGLEPRMILGDRWKQPWIDIPDLSLFVRPLVVVRRHNHVS
jgi:hypothetical protein